MKKQLLSIFAAIAVSSTALAQTPSPSWPISQNASFSITTAGIKFLDAVDANVVWATGYDGTNASRNYNWYSRTINGGTSFTSGNIFPDTNNYVLANMEGIDANTAWVCAFQHGAPYSTGNPGGGGVFKTTNGGATWVNMTPAGGFSNVAQSFADFVSFFTPSVGITVGDPVGGAYEVWRTVNGGSTWSPVTGVPAPLSSTEFAITNLYAKQGTSNFWFGTNQGRLFRSTDAGLTWSVTVVAASTTTLTQIAFTTPLRGVVMAFDGASNVEYNTTDGGATWTQIMTLDPNLGLNDMKAVPGTNYYVSADNTNTRLSYSSDNGVTWTDWGSVGIPYVTIDFANATSGWAGSFSDATTASVGGVWKYTGTTFSNTSNVAPTAAFTITPTFCGSTTTMTPANISTGSGALSYTWTSSPAAVFSSTSAAAPSIAFSGANTYTITLVTTNTVGTNTSSQIVTLLGTCAAPTASVALPNAAVCNNVAFTSTTTGAAGVPAAGYMWTASPSAGVSFSPSPTSASPIVKANNPGTYTLTLVASNLAGSVTTTQTVTISDCRPVPSFTLPTSVCRGDTIFALNMTQSVTGASSNTYTWTWVPTTGIIQANVNTPPQSKRFNFPATGATNVYTVTLKSANSSGSNLAVQVVTVGALPVIGAASQTVCSGSVVNLSPTGGVNYTVNPGSLVGNSSFTFNAPASAAAYVYSVSGSSTLNCVGKTTMTLNVLDTCGTTGIKTNSMLENAVSVYPNPAHSELNVSLPSTSDNITIKLINLLGSVVYEEKVNGAKNSAVINLGNKTKGVYFINVETTNGKVTRKVIVE